MQRYCMRLALAPSKYQRGLTLLLEAAKYAIQTRCTRWDFAVELDQLHQAGLSNNDLRLLVRMRLLHHANEATTSQDVQRKFRTISNLCFGRRTCFVLSSAGLATAISYFKSAPDAFATRTLSMPNVETSSNRLPSWDADRHVLTFRGQLVKQFKSGASNQEVVLSAFHEEGWPSRVDDPLSPSPVVDAKRRLSDAIRCLNRNQINQLIRFHGDGTGQGILWEAVAKHSQLARRSSHR